MLQTAKCAGTAKSLPRRTNGPGKAGRQDRHTVPNSGAGRGWPKACSCSCRPLAEGRCTRTASSLKDLTTRLTEAQTPAPRFAATRREAVVPAVGHWSALAGTRCRPLHLPHLQRPGRKRCQPLARARLRGGRGERTAAASAPQSGTGHTSVTRWQPGRSEGRGGHSQCL